MFAAEDAARYSETAIQPRPTPCNILQVFTLSSKRGQLSLLQITDSQPFSIFFQKDLEFIMRVHVSHFLNLNWTQRGSIKPNSGVNKLITSLGLVTKWSN
jgi:hypothetical protein